jgi:hypothetical protein
MTTLFTMTVDTEEEWDWGSGWPASGMSVTNVKNLPRLQRLCSHHGVAPTYFVNRAVLDDSEALQTVLGLGRCGRHEIGMHIHPWNTPPLRNGGPVTVRDTFLHNLDEQLIEDKLAAVYERFEQNGLKPTSFRGGRYSSGGKIHEFLQSRGFLVDSSVVPFSTWEDAGAPDYRSRDVFPVRLPARGSSRAMWEIPLTMGFTRRPFRLWARCYQLIERSWLRKLRLIGLADRVGLIRKVWLNFEDTPADAMMTFLHKLRWMNLPCICFTVHSSSLMAGKNAYTPTANDEERIFSAIERVLGTVAGWPEFRSVTMSEAASQLEEAYHARVGN